MKEPGINYVSEEPFFTHPCAEQLEDNARHILLHQYVACIKIPNTWAIPTDSTGVILNVPALVDILIGCSIWNPNYGYFLVMSYDKQGQKIVVMNKVLNVNVTPGTVVPSCTKFIITA